MPPSLIGWATTLYVISSFVSLTKWPLLDTVIPVNGAFSSTNFSIGNVYNPLYVLYVLNVTLSGLIPTTDVAFKLYWISSGFKSNPYFFNPISILKDLLLLRRYWLIFCLDFL